jgi:tetratricopeptide (TPR) repeat protein
MRYCNIKQSLGNFSAIKKAIAIVFSIITVFFISTSFALSGSETGLKAADEYLRTKNYLKARDLYRDTFILEKKGDVASNALLGVAKADMALGNYYEALQNLKRSIALAPNSEHSVEAHLKLGYALLFLNRLNEADKEFDLSASYSKDMMLIGKAEVAFRRGDIKAAEKLILEVDKKILSTAPRAVFINAEVYSRNARHREAVAEINKLSDAALKEERLRHEKAFILFHAGKIDDAKKIALSIISSPLFQAERLMAERLMFAVYETEKKYDDAIRTGQRLLSYEPSDDFRLRLVALYDKKQDIDSAMKFLTYITNVKLRSEEIEKRLRQIKASNNPKTLDFFIKYSGYISADNPFILEASEYMMKAGAKNEAMSALYRALKGAQRGEASLQLAQLLIGEGRLDEAKKILNFLSLDTRYLARASALLADIFEKEGNYNLAIASLLRIAAISKDAAVPAKLGDLYFKSGDKSNALKYFIIASDRGDIASSVKAADVLYLSGDSKKAVKYYKTAIDKDTKDAKMLQWAQYQYGKITGNNDFLKKAASSGGDIADAAKIIMGKN